MNTPSLEIGNAVEYIDDVTNLRHTGTVIEVDFGSGWAEVRVRIQWDDDYGPTWMRASKLRQIP